MNIAVIRLSALGDVVLAVPAIRALAQHYPDSRVVWMTSPAFLPVLRGLPANLELRGLDKPQGWADYRAIRRQYQDVSFDLLLAMQASLRINLLYPCLNAREKIGFDARRARDGHGLFVSQRIPQADHHLLDGFAAFAQAVGVPHVPAQWGLQLDAAAQDWAQKTLPESAYLVLNPCASKDERTWSLENNIQLIRQIKARYGLPVVLCGGRSEKEVGVAGKIAAAERSVLNLAGKTRLTELFALLAGAKAVISPDSGPVHIARAFDVPVVGLYAVARPELSGPYQALQWTVNRYPEALRTLLKKDAASADWHLRAHDARAMDLITVGDVLEKLDGALKARG